MSDLYNPGPLIVQHNNIMKVLPAFEPSHKHLPWLTSGSRSPQSTKEWLLESRWCLIRKAGRGCDYCWKWDEDIWGGGCRVAKEISDHNNTGWLQRGRASPGSSSCSWFLSASDRLSSEEEAVLPRHLPEQISLIKIRGRSAKKLDSFIFCPIYIIYIFTASDFSLCYNCHLSVFLAKQLVNGFQWNSQATTIGCKST